MANMSYCRFENTLRDLRDCERALNNGEADPQVLRADEFTAMRELIATCTRIANDWGDLADVDEVAT